MNVSRVATPLTKMSQTLVSRRFYAAPSKGQIPIGYTKIKEKYAKFQVDDGVPVHLKGGPFDRFLYYSTLVGCGVGLVMMGEYFYTAAFPKKC